MGKFCSCMQFIKSRIFSLQVTREHVSVLQVTRESVSGTASYVHESEHAMKLKVRIIKPLSPQYWKKYHSFVAVGIVTCTVLS